MVYKVVGCERCFSKWCAQEEVYMEQPLDFVDPKTSTMVCKLYKALYGLKQAPRAWFDKLHIVLIQLGFMLAKSNQSLFTIISSRHSTFVLVYFDDILLTGSNANLINDLVFKLNNAFALKDLGDINYFLGIQVKYTTKGLHLSQTKYIIDLY